MRLVAVPKLRKGLWGGMPPIPPGGQMVPTPPYRALGLSLG
jgi:hypothetical protein